MNPQGVKTLVTYASRLAKQKVPPTIPFAIRWIAWESLRTRTLVVATRLAGWSTTDAYFALSVVHVNNNKDFATCFRLVTNQSLDQCLRGDAAKSWRAIRDMEVLRHRLFHGIREPRPDVLIPASDTLGDILRHRKKLFGPIKVLHPCGTAFPIGDPLDKVLERPASSIVRRREELLELLSKKNRSAASKEKVTTDEAAERPSLFSK